MKQPLQTTSAKRLTVIAATLIVFSPLCCYGGDWVNFTNGLLSVDFRSLRLEQALDRITRETGVAFSLYSGMENDRIDVRFDGRSLERGIQEVLVGYNYVMLYGDSIRNEDNVEKVILIDKARNIGPRKQAKRRPLNVAPPESVVILKKKGAGHFLGAGKINRYYVDFLVDTGATLTVVPGALAREMNLSRGSEMVVRTANGRAKGFRTILQRVELGDLTLERVPALILPSMDLDRYVLLGMSFLNAFDLTTRNDTLVIKRGTSGSRPVISID
jgi:clan AA aspartic protease (TIGR02281 family)